MKKWLMVTLCWLMMATTAYTQGNETKVVNRKISQERGELRIISLDEGRVGNEMAVRLDGRVVVQAIGENSNNFSVHDFPLASTISTDFKEVVPFDDVFAPQQRIWGDACESGPIWFLGDRGDGSYAIADAIESCGGLPSMLTVLPEKVFPTIPGLTSHPDTRVFPQAQQVHDYPNIVR